MPLLPALAPVRVLLQTTPEQTERLRLLQLEFAQACNALAPLVQQTACWNRVALHHMAYRQLRAQFPGLGSQMVCNVVYSVSRTCRIVYQGKDSPFNLHRLAGRPLPLLRFSALSPVYFDRHTLSVKDGRASMYTLDGRMRFALRLGPTDDQRFRTERLREIVLLRQDERFVLKFSFVPPTTAPAASTPRLPDGTAMSGPDDADTAGADLDSASPLPAYVAVVGAQGPNLDALSAGAATAPARQIRNPAVGTSHPLTPDLQNHR